MISSVINLVHDEARRIWCFRWLAVATSAAILAGGAAVVSQLPTKYDAWGQVLVNKQTPLAAAAQSVSLVGETYGSPYVIQKTLLNDENLEAVIRQSDPAAAHLDRAAMAAAVANLRNHIRITPDAGDGFIEFHYLDSDPAHAQRMAKLLMDQFIARNLDRNRQDLAAAGSFLDNQIASYAGLVAESQAKIASFRRAQPLTRAVSVAPPSGSGSGSGSGDLAQATAPASLPSAAQDPRVSEARTRLAALQQVYTARHPDVIAAQRQLAQAIAERDAEAATTPATRAGAGHRNARPLTRRLVVDAPASPEVAARWGELQRADEALRTAYQQLVSKRQAARMSQAVYGADADAKYQITRAPTRPLTATGPSHRLYLAAVVGLALGGGVAAAWLRAAMAGVLVAPRELERIFQLPVVGTVSWEQTWETGRQRRRSPRRPTLPAKSALESVNP